MAARATQAVFADIESLREIWTVPAHTESLTAVLNGDRPGVTFIGTSDITRSITFGGMTLSGIPVPSNGEAADNVTVSTTGTFAFAVTGATGAETNGTKVYYVAADGTLTLTASSNVFFGVVNKPEGYVASGTVIPVKIGVVA